MDRLIITCIILVAGIGLAIAIRKRSYPAYYYSTVAATICILFTGLFMLGDERHNHQNEQPVRDFFLALGAGCWIYLTLLSIINLFLEGKRSFKIISGVFAFFGTATTLFVIWFVQELSRHRFGCG